MPISANAAHHRAVIASLHRTIRAGERPPDDPALGDAYIGLIADYIDRMLQKAPPLTDAQRDRLAELLRPVRRT
jgi:hypothetical protein